MTSRRHHKKLKAALAELGSRLNTPGIVKEIESVIAKLTELRRKATTPLRPLRKPGTMPLRRQRDAKGWRIPREGTKSRKIYDLLKAKKTNAEIVLAVPGLNPRQLQSLLAHIKQPDKSNATRLKLVKLKRDR